MGNQVIRKSDLNEVLDILLALDRMVVEHSMHTYNIPQRERFIMREQNRRLHVAAREYLHRLVEPSGRQFLRSERLAAKAQPSKSGRDHPSQ